MVSSKYYSKKDARTEESVNPDLRSGHYNSRSEGVSKYIGGPANAENNHF